VTIPLNARAQATATTMAFKSVST